MEFRILFKSLEGKSYSAFDKVKEFKRTDIGLWLVNKCVKPYHLTKQKNSRVEDKKEKKGQHVDIVENQRENEEQKSSAVQPSISHAARVLAQQKKEQGEQPPPPPF